jgi:hypothetical protein
VFCALADPHITEASGIVASSRCDADYFVHNDSGDKPRLYAIDRRCRLLATVTVTGADAVDWEDIARGPVRGGGPTLEIGDIGDNRASRRSIVVYEIAEPVIDTGASGRSLSVRATARRLTYEDGAHDAETLLVDPTTGRPVVVTKSDDGTSGVYVTDGGTLRRRGSIDFTSLASAPSLSQSGIAFLGRGLATGGDVAADGSRVVVRTYAEAFEWAVRNGDIVAAMAAKPQRVALPDEPQGEGIGYTRDGRDLVAVSEGAAGPFDLVPAAPGIEAGAAATSESPSTSRAKRDSSRPKWVLPAVGGAVAMVLLVIAKKFSPGSAGRGADDR